MRNAPVLCAVQMSVAGKPNSRFLRWLSAGAHLPAAFALVSLVCLTSCAGLSSSSSNKGGGGGSGPQTPSAPAGLQAAAANAQVSLSWSASTGATSYHVKRSTTSGGPYTQISAPTSTSFTDTGLTNGTAYFYVVSALNTAGESPNSAQATATPTAPVTTPPAPTGLQATAGNAQVSLAWSASTGATSYHVKRSTTSGGPYTQISAPASTSYHRHRPHAMAPHISTSSLRSTQPAKAPTPLKPPPRQPIPSPPQFKSP